MALDLSGVTKTVQDTLRAADEYTSHDPKLSAELSLRAYEICREFGIDVASLDEGKETAPHLDVPDTASIVERDELLVQGQADKHPKVAEDQDQLIHILDRQKTLVDAQVGNDGRQPNAGPRSNWSSSKIFNSLFRPQPI